MKRFLSILIAAAVVLTMQVTVFAQRNDLKMMKNAAEKSYRYIKNNQQVLNQARKEVCEALQAKYENWDSLTDEQKAELKAEFDKLVSEAKQAFKEKKQEYAGFRAQFNELAQKLRENRKKIISLHSENRALRGQIKARLSQIKDSGTVIDEAMLAEINKLLEAVKTESKAIRETKGDIKDIMSGKKAAVKNMDYETVKAAFEEAYKVQELRIEKLTSINAKLKELKAVLDSIEITTSNPADSSAASSAASSDTSSSAEGSAA